MKQQNSQEEILENLWKQPEKKKVPTANTLSKMSMDELQKSQEDFLNWLEESDMKQSDSARQVR